MILLMIIKKMKKLIVLPFILIAMIIGAILMWTAWALFFMYGGLIWL